MNMTYHWIPIFIRCEGKCLAFLYIHQGNMNICLVHCCISNILNSYVVHPEKSRQFPNKYEFPGYRNILILTWSHCKSSGAL